MADWTEPRDFNDWMRRVFSLRPMLLIFFVVIFVVSEFRFDWLERVVGNYLISTNTERPQHGAIWDKGRQARVAQKSLAEIIDDRQSTQREARNAASFVQIAQQLSPEQGVMLSVENFRSLYLELPPEVSRDIISPFKLLGLISEGRWRRTYLEKSGSRLTAYLLDSGNRVLQRLIISEDAVMRPDPGEISQVEALEEMPNFANRIYPAEKFFQALNAFPIEVQQSMVLEAERLLKAAGQIVQVGISDEASSGYIDIGFEIIDGPRRMILLLRGHEWAVWRLRSYLEGRNPGMNELNASVDAYQQQ